MARPREFDEDTVLEKALRVFWEKGYEGASLHDLLAAMGLTKSSLYKAFGSKESLFRKVRQKYQAEYLVYQREALAQPTPREIVERLLVGTVDLHCGTKTPLGCLETNGALACSSESDPIRLDLARSRDHLRSELRTRFDATGDRGSLPAGMSSDEAAFLIATLVQGMAVQAKGGAAKQDLLRLVESALLSWPEGQMQNERQKGIMLVSHGKPRASRQ
jgi:AcrR family transcriptional regulator